MTEENEAGRLGGWEAWKQEKGELTTDGGGRMREWMTDDRQLMTEIIYC